MVLITLDATGRMCAASGDRVPERSQGKFVVLCLLGIITFLNEAIRLTSSVFLGTLTDYGAPQSVKFFPFTTSLRILERGGSARELQLGQCKWNLLLDTFAESAYPTILWLLLGSCTKHSITLR